MSITSALLLAVRIRPRYRRVSAYSGDAVRARASSLSRRMRLASGSFALSGSPLQRSVACCSASGVKVTESALALTTMDPVRDNVPADDTSWPPSRTRSRSYPGRGEKTYWTVDPCGKTDMPEDGDEMIPGEVAIVSVSLTFTVGWRFIGAVGVSWHDSVATHRSATHAPRRQSGPGTPRATPRYAERLCVIRMPDRKAARHRLKSDRRMTKDARGCPSVCMS